MTDPKPRVSPRLARLWPATLGAGLILLSGSALAHADGNEFFQSVHTGIRQLVYVGNVRDDHGRLIKGALVNWLATASDGSGQTVGYGSYTDELGHYRTIDISLIMASMDYTFDPGRIVLSVSYPGYKVVRRFRRTPDNQTFGSIEMNFIVAPQNSVQRATLWRRWRVFFGSFSIWRPLVQAWSALMRSVAFLRHSVQAIRT